MTATQRLYAAAGHEIVVGEGECWLCGGAAVEPTQTRDAFIREMFTNHDMARAPRSQVVCAACAWCQEEKSGQLALLLGKDKPQKMRTYSHFIIDGGWRPFTKAEKKGMTLALLSPPFPRLAVISDTGQKHLIFRSRANPTGAASGWLTFEDQVFWCDPTDLRAIMEPAQTLYDADFTKAEILSGHYHLGRIARQKDGLNVSEFLERERALKPSRGGNPFNLGIWLLQKGEDDGGDEGTGSGVAVGDLAGD